MTFANETHAAENFRTHTPRTEWLLAYIAKAIRSCDSRSAQLVLLKGFQAKFPKADSDRFIRVWKS